MSVVFCVLYFQFFSLFVALPLMFCNIKSRCDKQSLKTVLICYKPEKLKQQQHTFELFSSKILIKSSKRKLAKSIPSLCASIVLFCQCKLTDMCREANVS